MTKRVMFLVALLFIAAPLMFGQLNAPQATPPPLVNLPHSLSMAIASGLCGLAQGKAVAGAAEAMARNPGATTAIRFALILGLVLIESLALYTLVIIFKQLG